MYTIMSTYRRVIKMADYEKMYYHLFNKVTDWIEEMKKVQCELEEMYIQHKEILAEKERSAIVFPDKK